MSKHTPGPWIAVGGWVEHPDDTVADICVCDTMLFSQGGLNRSEQEEFANARLIAAAPDLLDALQTMPQSLSNTEQEWWDWIDKARKAIDKATGEEK